MSLSDSHPHPYYILLVIANLTLIRAKHWLLIENTLTSFDKFIFSQTRWHLAIKQQIANSITSQSAMYLLWFLKLNQPCE